MDELLTFLAMGRHGVYVWTAYGATTLMLVLLAWLPVRNRRRFIDRERRRLEHAP